MISLFAEPLFHFANQRLGCYQIRQRFNICQQTEPARPLPTASFSIKARKMMLKEQLGEGREETVELILDVLITFYWKAWEWYLKLTLLVQFDCQLKKKSFVINYKPSISQQPKDIFTQNVWFSQCLPAPMLKILSSFILLRIVHETKIICLKNKRIFIFGWNSNAAFQI